MKLRIFGLALVGLLGLSSFYLLDRSEKPKSPEEVMSAFYNALRSLDFEQAKKYVTPRGVLFLDAMKNISESRPDADKPFGKMPELESVVCKALHKDVQQCAPCCEENGEVSNEAIYLVKVKKKWKVHFTKESTMGKAPIEDYDAFVAKAAAKPKLPSAKLGKVENTPEEVAVAFAKCMAVGDLAQAQKLASESSKSTLVTLQALMVSVPPEDLGDAFSGTEEDIESVDCEKGEDGSLICTVCCGNSELVSNPLPMIQEGKDWKVDFQKERPGSEPPAEEAPMPKAPEQD